MPDQSSAAEEHALIQEVTAPLATLPDDPVSETADIHFPVALRGYDRIAVDAYVKKTSQLVAELQATRSPEAAIRRALERVGDQISGILQRAHETAEQITTQSRREAEDRLEAARAEAARITADAAKRLTELDAETDRIWAERRQIVEDTRELARQLLGLTDSAANRFPAAEDTGAVTAEATRGEGEAPGARSKGEELADEELHRELEPPLHDAAPSHADDERVDEDGSSDTAPTTAIDIQPASEHAADDSSVLPPARGEELGEESEPTSALSPGRGDEVDEESERTSMPPPVHGEGVDADSERTSVLPPARPPDDFEPRH